MGVLEEDEALASDSDLEYPESTKYNSVCPFDTEGSHRNERSPDAFLSSGLLVEMSDSKYCTSLRTIISSLEIEDKLVYTSIEHANIDDVRGPIATTSKAWGEN